MRKKIYTALASLFLASSAVYADVFDDILNSLEEQTGLQKDIRHYTQQLTDLEHQTLQQLIGTAGLNLADKNRDATLQSWGEQTAAWSSVLNAYQHGGQGIGEVAKTLNKAFPIQDKSIVNPDPDSLDARYYELQAKTALAARAASQYDYDNLARQMTYTQKLLSLIPETKTLKDALDLQNRIQVENNLIQLEMLRLVALSNQQQAIQTQGEVNDYVNNFHAFQSGGNP